MKLPLDEPVATGRSPINLGPDISTAIMRTVEAGWVCAKQWSGVNTSTGEEPITERLRDGMRQVLRHEEFPWSRGMVVLPGTESRSRPDVLLPDGRTDIPVFLIEIFFRYEEHDPHAIIECKRIDGNCHRLCKLYVDQGIDRFRTGKYSGNHSTGFMIGYLIGGDATVAASGINRYLNGNEKLESSELIDELRAWQSSHPRKETSKIKLHHTFLSFEIA